MTVLVATPGENFPAIGTVENPSMFFDGSDLLLCYEIAPSGGEGNAVIKFEDVIDFRNSPMNVEGLSDCRYPISPWAFNEISNAEEIRRWNALKPRFWMISFNDFTVEVLFESVTLIFRTQETVHPSITLMEFLNDRR